jgi:hypothetical protein
MKKLLTTAAIVAALTTSAQAGLRGSDRASFVQAFMARCIATNTRYPAQAAWNYCNCGAQRAAAMTTSADAAERERVGHRDDNLWRKLQPWVAACKAAHLRGQ